MRSVSNHQFAMVPRSNVPRSRFSSQKTHKTTFDAGYLIPVYCLEVLPGDDISCRMTAFSRMSTLVYPIMDNIHFETFFFFVPNRLVWSNWRKFMGEQAAPGDSIAYNVPQIASPVGGHAVGSIFDYFGLPTVGQVAGGSAYGHSALPLRAYNLIYNEWFRDENLRSPLAIHTGDGPDPSASYMIPLRGKRHDYFTSCLPWPQKGSNVTMPLGTTADVLFRAGTSSRMVVPGTGAVAADGPISQSGGVLLNGVTNVAYDPQGTLYADLSAATAATVNQLRQSIAIQELLEADARGGTRYTEILRAHFGVSSPDARLQRPEYLGGGSTMISVNPIAQTSGTGASGTTSPLGNLGAMATGFARGHGFRTSIVEHGYIIGIANIRADLTYQQGLQRHWSRFTRYDFYFPEFAHLGEQAVLSKELYLDGTAGDNDVFGYQERWSEYRYDPSIITGKFRSTSAGTLDAWHLSQRFTSRPTLGSTFLGDAPPISRVLAAGAAANGQQFLVDMFFDQTLVRPLPMYSVPGFGKVL